MSIAMNERPMTLLDLTAEKRKRLQELILGYFTTDVYKPSLGMKRGDARFDEYSGRAVSEMLQSLHATSLLNKQGVKSDAAYQLTLSGQDALRRLRKELKEELKG